MTQSLCSTDDEHRRQCEEAGCLHPAVHEASGVQGWCDRCWAWTYGEQLDRQLGLRRERTFEHEDAEARELDSLICEARRDPRLTAYHAVQEQKALDARLALTPEPPEGWERYAERVGIKEYLDKWGEIRLERDAKTRKWYP